MLVLASVAITIVTFNSSRYIRRCLEYALQQDHPQIAVVVVDNASTDDTAQILREFESDARIVYNSKNVGFAAGQNQALGLTNADWALTLNPDCRLLPNFVSALVAATEAEEQVGSACGKLLAMTPEFRTHTASCV